MILIDEGFPSQTLIRMPTESIVRMRQLPICRSLYVTDIGHYPEARNHLVQRHAGCPNYILIYCTGGRGFCRLGDKFVSIEGGQAVLIPADVPHEYGTDLEEHWRIFWIHFNGSDAEDLFDLLLSLGRQTTTFQLPKSEQIATAFDDTIRWAQKGHTTSTLVALSGSCANLLGLVSDSKRPCAKRARNVEERVRSSMIRMKGSLRNPLTLEQLAAESTLSIPHYCSVFRKQTGSSPMQAYTQLRIQLACKLLHDTRLGIREIADETGYQDVYYFSRAFKKVMGIAPSHYRNGLERLPTEAKSRRR